MHINYLDHFIYFQTLSKF